MKPAEFDYAAPESVDEALVLLSQDRSVKILAGGQSLVPVLNFRLNRFDLLIDINRLTDLDYIRMDGDVLAIGALTRQRTIETSQLVASKAPLLSEATRMIAHLPIRTRGTIGGSVAHADPAAEDPSVLLALDATLVAHGPAGKRSVAAREFFVGLFETALAPAEILTEIRIPEARPGQGFAFEEISRRRGDFAIVGVSSMLQLDSGRIASARIALCGVGDCASRMEDAERVLQDAAPTSAVIKEAARAGAQAVSPQSDVHADADYRRHLVGVLIERAVTRAADNAMRSLS